MEEKEVKKPSTKKSTTKKTTTKPEKAKSVVKENPVKMEVISDDIKKQTKKKMPTWAILIIVLGVILFVLELIFVANNINDEMKALKLYEQDGIVYIDKGNLTITKDVVGYYNSESNVYYVEGYLHNNSDRAYKAISISYTIYDVKGNVLGESYAFLSNLEKGKTWNFKSVYDEIDSKDALRFEIREVTYFAGM